MSSVSVRLRKKWIDSPHFNPKLFLSDSANQSDSAQSVEEIKNVKKKRGRKKLHVNEESHDNDPNDTKENLYVKEKKNKTKKKAQIVEELLVKEADVEDKENAIEVPKKKRGRKKKYVLAPSESDESLPPPVLSPKANARQTRAQKQKNNSSNASSVDDVEMFQKPRKKKSAQIDIKKSDKEVEDLNVNSNHEWTPAKENVFNNNAEVCTGNLDRRSTFDVGVKKLPGTSSKLTFDEISTDSKRKSQSFEEFKTVVTRKSTTDRKKSTNNFKEIQKTPSVTSDKKSLRKTLDLSDKRTSKTPKEQKSDVKTVDLVKVRASIQKSSRKTSGDNLKRLGTRKSVRFNVSPKLRKSNSFPTVKTPAKIISPRKTIKREGTFELSPDKSLLRRSLNVSGVLNLNTSAKETNTTVDLTTPCATPNIARKSYKKTPAKLPSINIINESTYSLLQDASIPFNETTFDKSSKLNIDDVSPINKNKSGISEKSPASCTSTPLAKGESSLVKKALLKDNSFKGKRTKMPNFSKIHQKAYDKLENIQELSQRKAERARLLLSGHKPSTNLNKSRNSPAGASKKLFDALKVTPAGNKLLQQTKKLTPIEKMKSKTITNTPEKAHTSKEGYTRFGFKLAHATDTNKASRKEQIQAVANKTRPKRTSTEKRRVEIKGVRSNRRFELLMAMRKGNK